MSMHRDDPCSYARPSVPQVTWVWATCTDNLPIALTRPYLQFNRPFWENWSSGAEQLLVLHCIHLATPFSSTASMFATTEEHGLLLAVLEHRQLLDRLDGCILLRSFWRFWLDLRTLTCLVGKVAFWWKRWYFSLDPHQNHTVGRFYWTWFFGQAVDFPLNPHGQLFLQRGQEQPSVDVLCVFVLIGNWTSIIIMLLFFSPRFPYFKTNWWKGVILDRCLLGIWLGDGSSTQICLEEA